MTSEFECLSQVAGSILACHPSLGGLECNLDTLKNVLQPKRPSLGQSFVEVKMFLQLNKSLMASDPSRVSTLLNWRGYIPSRPDFAQSDSKHSGSEELNTE